MSYANATKRGGLLRNAGWTSIAVALAAMVLPMQASAQDRARLRVTEQCAAVLLELAGQQPEPQLRATLRTPRRPR